MPKLRTSGLLYSNNKTKLIIVMAFIIIVLTTLYIYKSYAYYQVTNSYNIIKGRVGSFTSGDLKVAIYLEDSLDSNTYTSSNMNLFPTDYGDGYVYKETICDSNADITPVWDGVNYQLQINGTIDGKSKCSVYFDRLALYTVTLTVNNATASTLTLTGYDGFYTNEATMMPNTNYYYQKAVCTSGTGSYDRATNKFKVTGLTANGTCTVDFGDGGGAYMLATWVNNGIPVSDTPLATTAFASVATTQEGVYPAEDDYGTSYYVRGASDYNYVKFGEIGGDPIWWNIIRINGDGTVRMIYRGIGETVPAAGNTISSQCFGASSCAHSYNYFVGYMYGVERQGLGTSSNAKNQLETWYENNLSTNYGEYIADRIFCGDRTSTTNASTAWPFATNTGGTGTIVTYYGAYARLNKGKTPILECPEEPDKYTVENATENPSTGHGNGALTHPIGLITADEVSFAGGVNNTNNSSYYLYSEESYWTMSPCDFNFGYVMGWLVRSSGIDSYDVGERNGLRAVINLKSETAIQGTGTTTDPFRLTTS